MTFSSENNRQVWAGFLLVVIGVLFRLLPHPDNFTPVTAIALFSGVVLPPTVALTAPLIIMMISDLIIGPHPLFFLTWGSFFLVSLIGVVVSRNARLGRIIGGTLAGSLLFFVVTNLGVFYFQDMYTKDSSGLAACFLMALPFFKNSLIGDMFFSAVLFGAFFAAKSYLKSSESSVRVKTQV